MEIDLDAEAAALKKRTELKKKRKYKQRKSKLDGYKKEVYGLHERGCTGEEIQYWLSQRRPKIEISVSAINRYIKQTFKVYA